MVPLEVTHTALVTPAVLQRISTGAGVAAALSSSFVGSSDAAASPLRHILVGLMRFFASTYE